MESKIPEEADLVVVGGGPAGSTVATLAADHGWRVVVLERERFPREHIGESLLPAALPILRRLGVTARMDQDGYLRKHGSVFKWGVEEQPWPVYFDEVRPESGYAYQVFRPGFDQLLLTNAKTHGAQVYEQVTARSLVLDGDRVSGVEYMAAGGGAGRVRSRYVIDASGQGTFIARARDLKRWDPVIRNMAVYGYFEGAERLTGNDRNSTLVEGFPDGWFWFIPLHTGQVSVGAVIDSRRLETGNRASLTSALHRMIDDTTLVRELTGPGQLVTDASVKRDWSYNSAVKAGPGFAMVGDAACFIDPLFSSGVHLAMTHAQLLVACLHAVIQGGVDEQEAFAVYEREYNAEYRDIREICLAMYAGVHTQQKESLFWEARRILGLPDSVATRNAFIRLISGRQRFGFETNPLSRLDLPPNWRRELVTWVEQLRARRTPLDAIRAGNAGQFLDAVPVTASGSAMEYRLIVAGETLVPGTVVSSPLNPRGLPLPADLAASLYAAVDGRRTIREIVDGAAAVDPSASRSRLLRTLTDLYWHGALELS